jgi:glycolate oxidase
VHFTKKPLALSAAPFVMYPWRVVPSISPAQLPRPVEGAKPSARAIEGIAKKYGLRIGNIFHAGDGNLHPLILFDPRDPAQLELVQQAGRDILEYCVSVGGSITGEHGVGLEKRDLMPLLFTDEDLDVMLSLRNAFKAAGVLNPGKLFPTTRVCAETRGPARNPVLAAEGM